MKQTTTNKQTNRRMNKCSIRRGKCVKTVTINSEERYKSPTDRHTHRLHAHMGNRPIMSWTKRAPSLTKHERMEQFKCRDAVLFRQENYFQLHRTRLAVTMRIENRWAYSMSWMANFGALGNVCVAKTVLRREKKTRPKKTTASTTAAMTTDVHYCCCLLFRLCCHLCVLHVCCVEIFVLCHICTQHLFYTRKSNGRQAALFIHMRHAS